MTKERILVTNDDGVDARGLKALIEIAEEFGDVTVVAPEVGMSGMSHSITMRTPLFLRQVEKSESRLVYACGGTPVDCMKIAMDKVLEEPPTLVLSGINHGANSNISVIYSGTMGAAIEGAAYSIPSIGLSLISHDTSADLTTAKYWAREIIKSVLERNSNPRLCLNVNIPDLPLSEIKGVKVCRQTKGFWREDFTKRHAPDGREYYWLIGAFTNEEPHAEDNDEWALANGYVAVVPVKVDLTDYRQLEESQSWFK